MELIRESIIESMEISLKKNTNLTFTLIETALVSTWKTAVIKQPILSLPGFTSMTFGKSTSSLPPNISGLNKPSSKVDTIVDKFYSLFKNHAKSITFIYNGILPSGNPSTTTETGIDIK